jgi:hypothetical protein
LACGVFAAPVEENQRFTVRVVPTNQKPDDSVKLRFLFFRQAIKIGLLKHPRSDPGRRLRRARILYGTALARIRKRRDVDLRPSKRA